MSDCIGIMGGTFDPIHYGHLLVAEEARCKFNLKKVIFVPSGKPPHKKDYEVTNAEYRYIMTALAIATNDFFEISRIEIEREGPSYAIDTIKLFKEIYKKEKIYFITGADAILAIFTWKGHTELIKFCNFIAATRPGYKIKDIRNFHKCYKKCINILEIPALSISSSDIRARIKEARPIKYLLPEPVERYIYQNKLYAK